LKETGLLAQAAHVRDERRSEFEPNAGDNFLVSKVEPPGVVSDPAVIMST